MTCRDLERLIDAGAPLGEAAQGHLVTCADCRELVALARASLCESPAPDPLLPRLVLARTTGPACSAAQDLLCDLADGGLAGVERELVLVHLGGCGSCAELAAAVGWIGVALPALGRIDPGDAFTAAVLRVTAPLLARERAVPVLPPSRFERWWRSLRDRPRLAWEAAYAGALVMWLLFGAGFSPFAGVPRQALELARINPVRALSDTVQPASLGSRVWESTGGRVAERTGRLEEPSAAFVRHGLDALGAAFQGDLTGSATHLEEMGGDLVRIYEALKGPRNEPKHDSQEV